MKKKVLASLLSVAMVATLLTGCGEAASTEAAAPAATEEAAAEEAAPAEEAEEAPAAVAEGEDPQLEKSIKILSIWDQGADNGELMTKICDQYIAEVNPNFSYEYEYVSSDDL